MRIALLCLLSGCLIAPSRPGGGDDVPDTCLAASDGVGALAVGILDRSTQDTIIRATTAKPFELLLYPATAPDARCPTRRITLSEQTGIADVAAINIVKYRNDPHIFALVRRTTGATVEAFSADGAPIGVISTTLDVGTMYGFVTTNADQVWFGGDEAIVVRDVSVSFSGPANAPPFASGDPGLQPWVHVAALRTPPSNEPFVAIGVNTTHGAHLANDVIDLDMRSMMGRCTIACPKLAAHDFDPAFGFDAYDVLPNAAVETISGMTGLVDISKFTPPASLPPPQELVDAVVDQLEGTNVLDLATLWRDGMTTQLWLYTDLLDVNQTGAIGKTPIGFTNVLRVVTARGPQKRIVVAGSTAGAQACFTVTPQIALIPCL